MCVIVAIHHGVLHTHTLLLLDQLVLEYEAASAPSNITALSTIITNTATNGSITRAVQGQGVNVTVGLAAPVGAPYNQSLAASAQTPSVPGSITAPPSSSGGGLSSGAIVGIVAGTLVVVVGAWTACFDSTCMLSAHCVHAFHVVCCMSCRSSHPSTALLVGAFFVVRRRRRSAPDASFKKARGPLDANPPTGAHASLWLEDADKKGARGQVWCPQPADQHASSCSHRTCMTCNTGCACVGKCWGVVATRAGAQHPLSTVPRSFRWVL